MSRLTETFCFKVSEDMKSFLDSFENPSDYVRSLIERQQHIKKDLSTHVKIVMVDGEEMIQCDQDKIKSLGEKVSEDLTADILKTMRTLK